MIAQYDPNMGHLSTILGPRDGNFPPKIQNVKCVHVHVFHIIFELPSYAVSLCAHPEGRRGGGVLPEQLCRAVQPASQNPRPIHDQNLRFSPPYFDLKREILLKYIPSSRFERENHILQGSTPGGCTIHFFHVGILNFEKNFLYS